MRLWTYVQSLIGARPVDDRAERERRAWDRRIKAIAFERHELQEIEREERRSPPTHQVERLEVKESGASGFGSVRAFAEEALRVDAEERVSVGAVFAAYTGWCRKRSFAPASIKLFADEFERYCTGRAVEIRPADGGIYCFGMRFGLVKKHATH